MRLAFAGTPEFARNALAALHDAGHDIPLVLTQPDRPAGRGMKLQASPVKQLALALGTFEVTAATDPTCGVDDPLPRHAVDQRAREQAQSLPHGSRRPRVAEDCSDLPIGRYTAARDLPDDAIDVSLEG